jgi:hypothetical protein
MTYEMIQSQLNHTLTKLQIQGWNRLAIKDLVLKEHRSWLEKIGTLKMESARYFDNQLHCIPSTWPLIDENNEPILTGNNPVSKIEVLNFRKRSLHLSNLLSKTVLLYW